MGRGGQVSGGLSRTRSVVTVRNIRAIITVSSTTTTSRTEAHYITSRTKPIGS